MGICFLVINLEQLIIVIDRVDWKYWERES